MKISVHALLILATTAKGAKVPRIRGDAAVASEGAADAEQQCTVFRATNDIDGCVRGAPHFDPQGRVCGNDGRNNEAYCNYRSNPTDANACIIGRCGLTPAEVYETRSWEELPPSVQNLYGQLGYDAFWWNNNLRPAPAAFEAWSDLSPAHRSAASALGYTRSGWDGADAGGCIWWPFPDPASTPFNFWCTFYTEGECIARSECLWVPDAQELDSIGEEVYRAQLEATAD